MLNRSEKEKRKKVIL